MASRGHRQKASDVYRQTEVAFGQKIPFADAFPEIEDVEVQVEETGVVRVMGTRVYSKSHLGEYIDCSNPVCYNGGFSIGDILREMVLKNARQSVASERCQGYEGSPKGRIRYHCCHNHFRIKVAVKYRE